MALSLELGRFVAGLRYEDIPADVREAIKTAFADAIGVAVGKRQAASRGAQHNIPVGAGAHIGLGPVAR